MGPFFGSGNSTSTTVYELMNCICLDGSNGFKDGMDFSDIVKKTDKLIIEENEKRGQKKTLSNPYH